ncbi:MAG TPA: ATP-binding cassette domain-containing protein, partial [Flavisolibacter sp.]|nr:ATP-binding cassette domain-containing protein [Flavisolibacter sp.]
LKDIKKTFGENIIVERASAEIDRGDKIALIGANGKGKSTLLRIIAGVESFEGERKWGHNVEESFYAQHQLEALNMNHTILDEMKECGSQMNELELRGLLGCFLFSGDDADKKIKILSGGEKARVALAKTIVSKANFLMLDEPTNHLDMHSCDLLIDALNKYGGSMILVSHDRYFISKTANKIWEIADHEIKEFKGGYEEWMAWKERMAERDLKEAREAKSSRSKDQTSEQSKKKEVLPINNPANLISPSDKSAAQKELQKQQKVFQKLEQDLAALNTQKEALEVKLAHPGAYSNPEEFKNTEASYKEVLVKLTAVTKEYEMVFEKMIALDEG